MRKMCSPRCGLTMFYARLAGNRHCTMSSTAYAVLAGPVGSSNLSQQLWQSDFQQPTVRFVAVPSQPGNIRMSRISVQLTQHPAQIAFTCNRR
jgi:hypothetical protein